VFVFHFWQHHPNKQKFCKYKLLNLTSRVQSGKSNSPWKSVAYLYRSLGIRGLYRGHGTTMTREVLYYTPYFLTYDTLRKFFQSRRDPVHDTLPFSPIVVAESMVSGGISGCIGWFIILPTDYVKSVCSFLQVLTI
jgi:hypothetical protein